jgi:hypothetical protein
VSPRLDVYWFKCAPPVLFRSLSVGDVHTVNIYVRIVAANVMTYGYLAQIVRYIIAGNRSIVCIYYLCKTAIWRQTDGERSVVGQAYRFLRTDSR